MTGSGYKLIATIVSKGKAGRVIDVAHDAGATGGTVLLGHGAAVRLLLGISIDPEKEIVLTVIGEDKLQQVLDAIATEMELDHPNKGLAFVLPLDQVVGFTEVVDDEF